METIFLLASGFGRSGDFPQGLHIWEAARLPLETLQRLFGGAKERRRFAGWHDRFIPKRPDGAIDGVVSLKTWGFEIIHNGRPHGVYWKEVFCSVSLPLVLLLLAEARDGRKDN